MKNTAKVALLPPFFFVFFLINNTYASELDNIIDNAAQNLIDMEKSTVYDRTLSNRRGSVGNNEKVKYTFDSNVNLNDFGGGSAAHISFTNGAKPSVISIFNNGFLGSKSEVFSLRQWSQNYNGLFYLENNGTIKGIGDWYTEYTMAVSTQNIYIKNTGEILHEKGGAKRYDNYALYAYASNDFVLDNSGTFRSGKVDAIDARASGKSYVINRETGVLSGNFSATNGLYFKNDGTATSLYLSGLTLGENTGEITSLRFYGKGVEASFFKNTGNISDLSFSNATLDLTSGKVKTVTTSGVTNIILGENTNIERINAGYGSDTLTLTEKNKLTALVTGIEHLVVSENADWEVSTNIKFSSSITVQGSLILDAENATSTVNTPKTIIEQSGSLATINGVIMRGKVENSGKFYVAQSANESEIKEAKTTVGSYVGNAGSMLIFNGELAGDDSKFNRLIITGNASGESYISLNKMSQIGGYTQVGIPLVEVQGNNNLTLKLRERLAFGAYNYYLTNTNKYFYLNSSLRPESGAYLANLIAANQMFDLRFNEHYSGILGDKLHQQGRQNGVWLKMQHRTTKFNDDSNILQNQVKLHSLLIGVDLFSGNLGSYRYNAGAMLGVGKADTQTFNPTTEYTAVGKVSGRTLGGYAGFYADNPDNKGFYGETWLQWNRFKNGVPENTANNYTLKGFKVSLELGYIGKLINWQNGGLFIQPQAQLLWNDIKGGNNHHSVAVKSEGAGFESRYGVKASANIGSIQPFFAIYQHRRSKALTVTMANTKVSAAGSDRRLELQMGIEGKFGQNFEWYLNAQQIKGSTDYREKAVLGGLRYTF